MMPGAVRVCARAAAAAIAVVVCLGARAAEAVPITITDANVWRADRSANPIGFPATALVPWVNVTTSSGNVNATQVTATIEGATYNLQRIPTGILEGTYFAQIPYSVSLDGDWTITATNGADVQQTTRPGFVPVDAMPFVTSIGFTGTGTNITAHWTVGPDGLARLDAQQGTVWDITNPLSPVTVQFFTIPVNAREVQLMNLVLGRIYAVEINQVDRNPATGYIDAFSGNWLTGWSPTQGEVQLPSAVPEPTTISLILTGLAGAALRRRRGSKP